MVVPSAQRVKLFRVGNFRSAIKLHTIFPILRRQGKTPIGSEANGERSQLVAKPIEKPIEELNEISNSVALMSADDENK